MSTATLLRSFTGGELTPELYGRPDLVKFQTGFSPNSKNFIVLPHGPVANRPGFEYVIETKHSAKKSHLIPFVFSTSQTYVLEFGDQYVRFHTQGATVLEASKAIGSITQASPAVVTVTAHGYTNGDWVYFSSMSGMEELNGRYFVVANKTTNTFELTNTAGDPVDTSALGAFVNGNMARVYELATPYLEADLFDLHYTQSSDVLTIVHPSYQQRELRRLGATNWQLATLSFTPTTATPAAPTATAGGSGGGSPVTHSYLVTALAADTLEESLASNASTASQDLDVDGNYVDVTPAAIAGVVRFNVYKLFNGLYGYIGQTVGGSAFRDNNVTPDVSQTPPEPNDPFVGANNYPGAVGYFQGRRWFAGTNNKTQNLWATRSGTESNMSYSVPTRDDDSIAVRLTSRQANTIRHILPLGDLLLLTSGAEWKIDSGGAVGPITPTTIDYRPEDYIGASNVQPVITSSAVLYAEDGAGGHVLEMRYTWEAQGYRPVDISIMAPHLFDNFEVTAMAFCRKPWKALFATRDDGTLIGLTYVPEHEVFGWHHHDTQGKFESVTSVREGNEDVLYAIVQREINGRTVRYLERLHTRQFENLEDCFFVDAGATYNGASTDTITGLWHLEGETVSVLADGGVHPQVVVTNGTITLQNEASVVHVGLAYDSDLETLPLAMETEAFGQALRKNPNKIHLRVQRSSSIFVGPSFDKLTEAKQRTNESYGSPPRLVSAVVPVVIKPGWGDDGTFCVRQPNPLPLTILGLVPEIAG